MHNGPDTMQICEASPLLVSRSLKRTLANNHTTPPRSSFDQTQNLGKQGQQETRGTTMNGLVIMRPFAQRLGAIAASQSLYIEN